MPDYWARVAALTDRLYAMQRMEISEPIEVEAWCRLMSDLIIESAALALTFEELVED